MFEERVDVGPVTLARGDVSSFSEVANATMASQIAQGNLLSGFQMQERAYDDANAAIKDAIGVELDNPFRQADKYSSFGRKRDFHSEWEARRAELEQQHPDKSDLLKSVASPREAAAERARRMRDWQTDVASRYGSGAWVPSLIGGFRGSLEDPTTYPAMLLGPMGRVGTGASQVLWMGVKQGVANAAVEAASQPFIMNWRKQAGIETSLGEVATDVATAFGLGFAMDAGIRSGFRAVQAGRGRVAILDKNGKVSGYKARGAPEDALQAAAEAAPKTSLVRKAADGDADAIHRLAKDAGIDQDPAYKGARNEVQLESELAAAYKLPDAVSPDDGFAKLTQAMKAAIDPMEPLPRGADPVLPARPAKEIIDDAGPRDIGQAFKRDGKPVTLERIDPATIGTDPAAFQFKAGGDGAGEIGTLAGVRSWDPLSSNRVIVFERTDGSRVIADGHQRLGLAKRLADQKPTLDAFVMREADGWTAGDVRAIAAQKNLKEGTGSTIDAAKILRDRPDLVDGSLPLNNAAMRQARALSRLEDSAFAQVIAGGAEPSHGALIADLVENKGLHAGMLAEMTRAAPETLREARLLVGEMLEAKSVREVQETLFGLATTERTLHAERAKVLDKAIKAASRDARLFGLVERERGRLTEAGNTLSAANATEAERAAMLGDLIERLGRTRGPVSDWLDEASRLVAAGAKPQTAADAFTARVARALEEGGMAALTHERPVVAGIDVPHGPEIDARIKSLDQRLDNALRAAKAVNKGEPEQGVMFALAKGSRDERRAATDAALLEGRHALTPLASHDMAALKRDIEAAIAKVAPKDVLVRMHDTLSYAGRGVEGYFEPHERIIHIALSANDPLRVGFEEAGHALKAAGLVTDADYAALTRFAEAKGLRKAFDIDGRYGEIYGQQWKGDKTRIEAALVEETVMQMLARRATGERFDSTIDRVLDAINRVLNAVRETLGLRGYRSVHDVFRAFESGDLAAGAPTVDIGRLSTFAAPPQAATVRAFHATNRAFDRFDPQMSADFGVHFGTARQAGSRLADTKRIDGGRTIPVDVTVKNAITMDDPGFWGPMEVVGALQKQGYRVTKDEFDRFTALANAIDVADADVGRIGDTVRPRLKAAVNEANAAIRAKLGELGIDGIWYKNQTEGRGWSLAVWGDNQVRNAMTRNVMLAFAGENAVTADLKMRDAAVAMDKAGKPREDIWHETGWFKGADGKWRFEISDHKSEFNHLRAQQAVMGVIGDDFAAEDLFKHRALYDAYPGIAEQTTLVHDGRGGSYGNKVIDVGTQDAHRTMLHELQHVVQDGEGFAVGGSPYHIDPQMKDAARAIAADAYRIKTGAAGNYLTKATAVAERWLDTIAPDQAMDVAARLRKLIDAEKVSTGGGAFRRATDEELATAKAFLEEISAARHEILANPYLKFLTPTDFDIYRMLAGEAEALVVEKRMSMTPEQRAARPPWLDLDVPEELLLVRLQSAASTSLSFALGEVERAKELASTVGACKS